MLKAQRLGMLDALYQLYLRNNDATEYPYSIEIKNIRNGNTHILSGNVFARDEAQANHILDKISAREQQRLSNREEKQNLKVKAQNQKKRYKYPMAFLGVRKARENIRRGAMAGGVSPFAYTMLIYSSVEAVISGKGKPKSEKDTLQTLTKKYIAFTILAALSLAFLSTTIAFTGQVLALKNYASLLIFSLSSMCALACKKVIATHNSHKEAEADER